MWNCPSKLKLDGRCRFHARGRKRPRVLFSTRCCTRGLWLVHGRTKSAHACVTRRAVSASVISACLGFLSQGPNAPEPFLLYHSQTSSRRDRSHCLLPL